MRLPPVYSGLGWDAQFGTTPCSAALFLIIASIQECTFHTGPSFCLFFESIMEQTSELEDAIDVDGQLLLLKYLNTPY